MPPMRDGERLRETATCHFDAQAAVSWTFVDSVAVHCAPEGHWALAPPSEAAHGVAVGIYEVTSKCFCPHRLNWRHFTASRSIYSSNNLPSHS